MAEESIIIKITLSEEFNMISNSKTLKVGLNDTIEQVIQLLKKKAQIHETYIDLKQGGTILPKQLTVGACKISKGDSLTCCRGVIVAITELGLNPPEDLYSIVSKSNEAIVNLKDTKGNTFFHNLCANKHPCSRVDDELLRLLQKRKVDMALPDGKGVCPLSLALQSGNVNVAAFIIRNISFSADERNSRGENYLHFLCKYAAEPAEAADQLAVLRGLLQANPNMYHESDVDGWFPIHYAVKSANKEIICHFLENFDNNGVDFATNSRETPLHVAAQMGWTDIISLLLSFSADLLAISDRGLPYDVAKSEDVKNALRVGTMSIFSEEWIADVMAENVEEVAQHVEDLRAHFDGEFDADTSFQAKSSMMNSAALVSCAFGALSVCSWVMQQPEFLPDYQDASGHCLVHILAAKEWNHADYLTIFQDVLRISLSASTRGRRGNTPLHIAARAGNYTGICLLTQYQAQMNVLNNLDETELHAAVMGGSLKCVTHILACGGVPCVKDQRNRMPAELAQLLGKQEILESIQSYEKSKGDASGSGGQNGICFVKLQNAFMVDMRGRPDHTDWNAYLSDVMMDRVRQCAAMLSASSSQANKASPQFSRNSILVQMFDPKCTDEDLRTLLFIHEYSISSTVLQHTILSMLKCRGRRRKLAIRILTLWLGSFSDRDFKDSIVQQRIQQEVLPLPRSDPEVNNLLVVALESLSNVGIVRDREKQRGDTYDRMFRKGLSDMIAAMGTLGRSSNVGDGSSPDVHKSATSSTSLEVASSLSYYCYCLVKYLVSCIAPSQTAPAFDSEKGSGLQGAYLRVRQFHHGIKSWSLVQLRHSLKDKQTFSITVRKLGELQMCFLKLGDLLCYGAIDIAKREVYAAQDFSIPEAVSALDDKLENFSSILSAGEKRKIIPTLDNLSRIIIDSFPVDLSVISSDTNNPIDFADATERRALFAKLLELLPSDENERSCGEVGSPGWDTLRKVLQAGNLYSVESLEDPTPLTFAAPEEPWSYPDVCRPYRTSVFDNIPSREAHESVVHRPDHLYQFSQNLLENDIYPCVGLDHAVEKKVHRVIFGPPISVHSVSTITLVKWPKNSVPERVIFQNGPRLHREILIRVATTLTNTSFDLQPTMCSGRILLDRKNKGTKQVYVTPLTTPQGTIGLVSFTLEFKDVTAADVASFAPSYQAVDPLQKIAEMKKATRTKSVGHAKVAMGYKPKYPILIVPGLASSAMECLQTPQKEWHRERVWIDPFKIGNLAAIQKISNKMTFRRKTKGSKDKKQKGNKVGGGSPPPSTGGQQTVGRVEERRKQFDEAFAFALCYSQAFISEYKLLDKSNDKSTLQPLKREFQRVKDWEKSREACVGNVNDLFKQCEEAFPIQGEKLFPDATIDVDSSVMGILCARLDAFLAKGSVTYMKNVVKMPKDAEPSEWYKACVCILYQCINSCYWLLPPACNDTTCPTMSASISIEYKWADGENQITPLTVPAVDYVTLLNKWIVAHMGEVGIDSSEGKKKAKPSATIYVICKKLVRILGHIAFSHPKGVGKNLQISSLEVESKEILGRSSNSHTSFSQAMRNSTMTSTFFGATAVGGTTSSHALGGSQPISALELEDEEEEIDRTNEKETYRVWTNHMLLAADGVSDPPGVIVRPVQGLHGIDFLAESVVAKASSYVFGHVIKSLTDLGYGLHNLDAVPYDWRLPPDYLQIRDNHFGVMKAKIECMRLFNGEKVVLLGHSMGCRCIQYFLHWVERHFPGWSADNVQSFLAMGPPFLGAPKCIRTVLTGDSMGLEVFLTAQESVLMAQHSSSLPWLYPVQPDLYPEKFIRFNASQVHLILPGRSRDIGAEDRYVVESFKNMLHVFARRSEGYLRKYYEENDLFLGNYKLGMEQKEGKDEEEQELFDDPRYRMVCRQPVVVQPPPVQRIWVLNGINRQTEVSYFCKIDDKKKPLLDGAADKYSNKPTASVNPLGMLIEGGVMYETASTFQPAYNVNKSGDGTVTYCSLNFAEHWAQQPGGPHVFTTEIDDAEHREMLANEAIHNVIADYCCELKLPSVESCLEANTGKVEKESRKSVRM